MADLPVRRASGGGVTRQRAWDPLERMTEGMAISPLDIVGRMFGGRDLGEVFTPAFEVKETKDAYIFKADLPGVKEEDVEVTVTGNRIQVSGKREEEKQEENERFYAYERNYGSFSRSFTLPEGVDSENVDAGLTNGVLSLRIGKKPEIQPKRIQLGRSHGNQKGDKAKA